MTDTIKTWAELPAGEPRKGDGGLRKRLPDTRPARRDRGCGRPGAGVRTQRQAMTTRNAQEHAHAAPRAKIETRLVERAAKRERIPVERLMEFVLVAVKIHRARMGVNTQHSAIVQYNRAFS